MRLYWKCSAQEVVIKTNDKMQSYTDHRVSTDIFLQLLLLLSVIMSRLRVSLGILFNCLAQNNRVSCLLFVSPLNSKWKLKLQARQDFLVLPFWDDWNVTIQRHITGLRLSYQRVKQWPICNVPVLILKRARRSRLCRWLRKDVSPSQMLTVWSEQTALLSAVFRCVSQGQPTHPITV